MGHTTPRAGYEPVLQGDRGHRWKVAGPGITSGTLQALSVGHFPVLSHVHGTPGGNGGGHQAGWGSRVLGARGMTQSDWSWAEAEPRG